MNASQVEERVRTSDEIFSEALSVLQKGTKTLRDELRKIPEIKMTKYFLEIESVLGFLETLNFIRDTMSDERLQETLRNVVKSVQRAYGNIPRKYIMQLSSISTDPQRGLPDFLFQAYHLLGPFYRISQNEMSAWLQIDVEEAPFFTVETVIASLKPYGIVRGIDEKVVREIFDSSQFNQELCIAKGKAPTPGKDGSIHYNIDVEDLGRAPKDMENGSVSFKDIKLFDYIGVGDILAEKIPPTPGSAGYTVTDKFLKPLEADEVEFPECGYTKVSEDGKHLIVTENCCITKKDGQVILEPSLKIAENVSFKTGNINSKVSIMVDEDVLTDFSVKSDMDILVKGIVEGAKLEAQGKIVIKGGIQGKDKAVIEANEDITAKFISNAAVTGLRQIIVESEIMHSKIWSGSNVIVSGMPGRIVGGEIDSEADIVANTIGSELGVKTVIRMGGRIEELASMVMEVQEKIAEQEEAVEKCTQIIGILQQRIAQSSEPPEEMRKSLAQAEEMARKARNNLDELNSENDGLQAQYEDSLKQTRTVRARENIMPGTVIDIQGAELIVKDPTGPATVLKQGDGLVVFPYKDTSVK